MDVDVPDKSTKFFLHTTPYFYSTCSELVKCTMAVVLGVHAKKEIGSVLNFVIVTVRSKLNYNYTTL